MTETHEHDNISVQETSINTINYSNVEVPNSQGAKAVIIEDIILDCDGPQAVASTETVVNASVLAGKITPTTCNINQEGTLLGIKEELFCDASAVRVYHNSGGPIMREGPFPIFKDTRDGKFYVTIAVKGTDCTAVRGAYARLDYTVVR